MALDLLDPAVSPGRDASHLDREEALAWLARWGRSSFARIAFLPGFRHFFSPADSRLVSYRLVGSVACAFGPPVGPPGDAEVAFPSFTTFCRRRGWIPVLLPVDGSSGRRYAEAGYQTVALGREGRLTLDRFHLRGRSHRSLRGSVNRAQREGLSFSIWDPPHDARRLAELKQVSDLWLREKRLPERQLGGGWFHAGYLDRGRIAVVQRGGGSVAAFVTLHDLRRGESGVDLMRYRPQAPPGTMDALYVALIAQLGREGRSTLNLGLAPLAGVGGAGAPPAERLLGWVYRAGQALYDFPGLQAFKAKFDPEWSDRYLVTPRRRDLLRVLWTLTELSPRPEKHQRTERRLSPRGRFASVSRSQPHRRPAPLEGEPC